VRVRWVVTRGCEVGVDGLAEGALGGGDRGQLPGAAIVVAADGSLVGLEKVADRGDAPFDGGFAEVAEAQDELRGLG
jgi:hypothetical protein